MSVLWRVIHVACVEAYISLWCTAPQYVLIASVRDTSTMSIYSAIYIIWTWMTGSFHKNPFRNNTFDFNLCFNLSHYILRV